MNNGRHINWRKKPCPERMKGERCPLCGCVYICGDSSRPKPHEVRERTTQKDEGAA